MIALENFEPVPDRYRGAFLAIGNFDGVHLGHAHLIDRLRRLAHAVGAPAIALTFDPAPAAVLRPGQAPPPLTWTGRKVELLHAAGADAVGLFRTGPWLLGLTAREFFERVVLGQFGARGMVEGPTFGFGRDRGGDARILGDWCAEAGLAFEVASPTDRDGTIVSSTRIRSALAQGDVAQAAGLLGRPHRLQGVVVQGAQRGRQLGFPTANLDGIGVQIPLDGVYAGLARRQGPGADPTPVATAVHIGANVTFGASHRTVEAHLLDFAGDLYGQTLALDLLERIRTSQKFDGVPALVAQMHADIARTRTITAAALAR